MPASQKYNNLTGNELGQQGFDHIVSTDGTVTVAADADYFDRWLWIVPANGTTPTLGAGTNVMLGDQFVTGQTVPEKGLYAPFDAIELSAGEVYAYRG